MSRSGKVLVGNCRCIEKDPHTILQADKLERRGATGGNRSSTVNLTGSKHRNAAAGIQVKKMSSNVSVKSNDRQNVDTRGPNILSLPVEQAIARATA
jgi:hypothetical protein